MTSYVFACQTREMPPRANRKSLGKRPTLGIRSDGDGRTRMRPGMGWQPGRADTDKNGDIHQNGDIGQLSIIRRLCRFAA